MPKIHKRMQSRFVQKLPAPLRETLNCEQGAVCDGAHSPAIAEQLDATKDKDRAEVGRCFRVAGADVFLDAARGGAERRIHQDRVIPLAAYVD